jgi:hypothetical protein
MAAEGASSWIILLAVTLTIIVTYLGSRWIKRQRKVRQEKLDVRARDAMEAAMDLVHGSPSPHGFIRKCATDEGFRENCTALSTCAELRDGSKNSKEISKIRDRVSKRADFYAKLDAQRLGFYVAVESSKLSKESAMLTASYLIGLLTDLSPLWIYDCGTNRKGGVPETRPQ